MLRGLELGGAGDVLTHLLGLEVRSKLLARRGDFSGALTLAQQADELAGATQAPLLKADAALALAEVLYLSGNIARAGEQAARAIDHFERKGSTAGVAQVHRLVASWDTLPLGVAARDAEADAGQELR